MTGIPLTVPELFLADPGAHRGPERCFYCGTNCGQKHSIKEYVKDTFVGHNDVVCPRSKYVCQGCTVCFQERATITLVGGEERTEQRMRGYSWLLQHRGLKRAATKAHFSEMRQWCSNPPEPPFAVVLTDSGQRQYLYRGVVNHERSSITVTLEGERISFRPDEFKARLNLFGRVCAATGKPALLEPIGTNQIQAVRARYKDWDLMVDTWTRTQHQPLSRLVAWMCFNKEEACVEYPSDRDEQPKPVIGVLPAKPAAAVDRQLAFDFGGAGTA